jgi:glycosyltransferase involved in cell wall biosynthesis
MKLIYLANARMPTEKAHGLQIIQMCEAFVNLGMEVELIVPFRFNKLKQNPFDYYGIDRKFEITRLPCLDLISLGFGLLGFWIANVTFLLVAKIYLLFKKYDILYTREAIAALLFNAAVVEIHSLPERLRIFIYHQARKIIVLTSFLKIRLIKEAGLSEDKVLVAADGVDLKKFDIKETKIDCRHRLNLPIDKKIILYAGHLYKWKGVANLLNVSRKLQHALFVFVGGTEEDVTDFKIQARGLSNTLITNYRPHAEIPYYLKAADVLVLPNSATEKISSHYTSPMKLFEYMAASRPIIAADLPSLREILNEDNAILVKPDSPQDLAHSVEEVLKNKELADRIAENAKQNSVDYSWEKRAKKIKDFIL